MRSFRSLSGNLLRGTEEDHGKHLKLAVPMAEIQTCDVLETKNNHTLYYILYISVCILSGYWLEGRCSIPGTDKRFFSLLQSVQTGSEANIVSYPMGIRDCFP